MHFDSFEKVRKEEAVSSPTILHSVPKSIQTILKWERKTLKYAFPGYYMSRK
jgi:hypothetical protein